LIGLLTNLLSFGNQIRYSTIINDQSNDQFRTCSMISRLRREPE